jgi:hypothetical protein
MSWSVSQRWLARKQQHPKPRFKIENKCQVFEKQSEIGEAIQWTNRKSLEKKIRMWG